MHNSKGLPGTLTLLALLISGSAFAAANDRPQLRNYASYTDFLRAVVDYTRNNGTPPAGEQQCRDDEVGQDGQPLDKQNPCRVKAVNSDQLPLPTGGSRPEPADNLAGVDDTGLGSSTADGASNQSQPDSLEQAIALARDGLNPHYSDSSSTRTTFSSFPMQPIDAGDLAQVSLIDALTGLMISTNDARIRLNIDPSKFTDPLTATDTRVAAEGVDINLGGLELQQALISNILPFTGGDFIWTTNGGTYYSIVNATPSYIDGRGISLSFSTRASIRAAIVDSDGWLQSSGNPFAPTAGAVVIDPLNISTGTITANLFAVDNGSGNTSILASLQPVGDIVLDLSNSSLGVASATRNGSTWNIGQASNFMSFGPDSVLSIRLDSPLETVLSNPDSTTNTPLVRVNGSISKLSLSEIALIDGSSKNGIHLGRLTINNLAMVNTSVYFENNAIRVDLGDNTNNLYVTIERIVFGGTMQDLANGTLPASIGDAEARITTPAHMQITLQAH